MCAITISLCKRHNAKHLFISSTCSSWYNPTAAVVCFVLCQLTIHRSHHDTMLINRRAIGPIILLSPWVEIFRQLYSCVNKMHIWEIFHCWQWSYLVVVRDDYGPTRVISWGGAVEGYSLSFQILTQPERRLISWSVTSSPAANPHFHHMRPTQSLRKGSSAR